ncbi:MAG: M15 family metallopeptidase [Acutalibacter sp.]|nr:M15 family metallopeptidase [Acutalibacter sp.]
MNRLILVNRQYPYTIHVRRDLAPVLPAFPHILLEREAAHALSRLMEELDGWAHIVPVSGWRSFAQQQRIYLDSLRDNGREFTKQFVALPGHSEHQTGLAIDLGLRGENVDFIRPNFPYEGICQRFRELAPAYGFIERYPAGKERVTGISHEPWHFRYVGIPHGEHITRQGLCLEEYLA